MPEFPVRILSIQTLTYNVKRYVVERPLGYDFQPGQATEVSIPLPSGETEAHPFTFTGLPDEPHLEFTIKSYRDHDGVTKRLDGLKPGDRLMLHEVWGAIHYTGPGLFLAAGTGLTPFLAIFRSLKKTGELAGNRLIYANRTWADVIHRAELEELFGSNLTLIFSREPVPDYPQGRITKKLLEKALRPGEKNVYLCGPDEFIESLKMQLKDLGVSESHLILEL